jgi:aryl-alcohol dehydrogenase-like predicted oxidoreductase
MRTVPLGRTRVTVSEFFFGAGAIGGIGSSSATRGLGLSPARGVLRLDEARARGITVVDTANSYAGGESERVVGSWARSAGASDTLIATKVGNIVEPGQTAVDLTTAHITRQYTRSLVRLGRIDLYLSHAPDPSTPLDETVHAFAALVAGGHICAWGCSNVTADELADLLSAADAAGVPRPGWVQNGFNLLRIAEEREVLALVRSEGLGYTPYSPLAGGVLSDRYLDQRAPRADSRIAVAAAMYADAYTPANLQKVAMLARIARRRSVSTAALALAWLRSHPDVTAPIISPHTSDQWDAVDQACARHLDAETYREITATFDA